MSVSVIPAPVSMGVNCSGYPWFDRLTMIPNAFGTTLSLSKGGFPTTPPQADGNDDA